MNADVVLDTNVLVHATSTSAGEPDKAHVAEDLIRRKKGGLSGQILQEFFVTVTRKGRTPLTPDEALEWIEALEDLPCVPIDAPLVRLGIDIARRHRVSYWDGAILAAAHRLRADILYTEDLSHGQLYGAVRVVNPFLPN